jgi:hypothetical protein
VLTCPSGPRNKEVFRQKQLRSREERNGGGRHQFVRTSKELIVVKIRLTAMLLLMLSVVCVGASSASAVTYTRNINPLTTVTVSVNDVVGPVSGARTASTGGWKMRDAKCVVKYWDDPWHKILDYQYIVRKHWDYNLAKNRVRNAVTSTDPWINATIRSTGGWYEEFNAMDYYYSRNGTNNMDAHYSERHIKFHCIIGIKGFSIPVGTWTVNVWFRVFAKNRPGSNQNWQCDVTQKWRYGS